MTITQKDNLLSDLWDDFGDELTRMNRHDRNVLMVALASQQYYSDARPDTPLHDLPSLVDCATALISEDDDQTTDQIEAILERYGQPTTSERKALIQLICNIGR